MRRHSTLAALAMSAMIAMPAGLGQQTTMATRQNAANEVLAPPPRPRMLSREERCTAAMFSQMCQSAARQKRFLRGERNIRNAWRSALGHFSPAKQMACMAIYSADASRLFAAQAQAEDRFTR